MPQSQRILTGKVDRISSSGNAMVTGEGVSANLGPLPSGIVGDEVQFVYEGGTFGVCVDIKYIDAEYIEAMSKKVCRNGFDSAKIKPSDLSVDADIPNTIETGDMVFAEHLWPHTTQGSIIDIRDSQFLVKLSPLDSEEWGCLGVLEKRIIQDETPALVTVTDIHSTHVELKGALPELEHKLPDIGETTTATTGPQHGTGTLAVYEDDYAIPVLLENVNYPGGEYIKVRITDVKDTHLIGEAAFSTSDFDTIHLHDDEIPKDSRQSQNRVIKNEVPIDIESVPADATMTTEVTVTGETSNALVGRWNIQEEIGPVDITKGDIIDLEIHSVCADSCVGYYEQLPVRVEFDTDIPSEFKKERISVLIRAVHPDKAIARPKWIEQSQGALEVQVVGTTAENAIAINDGRPVQIPNSSIVESGDQLVVGISESKIDNITNATVSARPVFQHTAGPHLIRLPQTRGDVVQASDTPVVVDHLPELESTVTLGVAEANEDHIVPTISALPETHIPNKGDFIFAKIEAASNDIIIGITEELPLTLHTTRIELPMGVEGDTITSQVCGHYQSIIRSVSHDADEHVLSAYEYLHSADSAFRQRKYQDAVQHLTKAIQSCPSSSVLKRLLMIRKIMTQAVASIQSNLSLIDIADAASDEANRLHEFNQNKQTTAEMSSLLSAREAEMRAIKSLLTALSEVTRDTGSNLQPISRGEAGKALRCRPLILSAKQHIADAEEAGAETQFKQQIPSDGLWSVVDRFKDVFPITVDQLQSADFSGDSIGWLQLLPQKKATYDNMQSDDADADSNVSGNIWKRPETPKTTGVTSIEEIGDDENTHRRSAPTTQNFADGTTVPGQASISDDSSEGTTESTSTGETSSGTVTGESNETTPESEASTEATETSGPPGEGSTTNLSGLQRLRKQAEAEASENPEREQIETTTSQHNRSSKVRKYALERADGNCESCGETAPFVKEDNEPFLEVHHVEGLAEGGADHPSLVAAICPNCHREIHHGKRGDKVNEELRTRLQNGLADMGTTDN